MGFPEPKEENGSSSKAPEGHWGLRSPSWRLPSLRGTPGTGNMCPRLGIMELGVFLLLMTSTDHPDTPHPCTHGDVPTCQGQTTETNFNRLGHTVCHGNRYQPYPSMASIVAWMEVNQHRNKRFPDLYIMDKVWAVKRIWKERIKSVELSPFQEVMLESGLREFHKSQDQVLGCCHAFHHFPSNSTKSETPVPFPFVQNVTFSFTLYFLSFILSFQRT